MLRVSSGRALITGLGLIVFISMSAIPSLVASSQMYLVTKVFGETATNCSVEAHYFTITKAGICLNEIIQVCNDSIYTYETYQNSNCSGTNLTNSFPIGCASIGTTFETTCVDVNSTVQSLIPPSHTYSLIQYSTSNCAVDTEVRIEGYNLNSCFKINSNQWAKYTCDNGQVNIRSSCNDNQCSGCDDVSSMTLDQCNSGTKATCVTGCDLFLRQQCDTTFNLCDVKSSACECYQVWGQCVYNSGCDDDQSAEKSCQEFCGANSCKCNFVRPCGDDSISNSLLVNLILVGGSISLYFFLLS